MAAGGVGGVGQNCTKTFDLPASSISVIVMEGDIVKTSAQAIATGEDYELGGRGLVSQLLIKSCPPMYRRARDELKKNTRRFEFGKVYPCAFPSSSSVSFNVVIHAIVPSPKVVTKPGEWNEQMKVLYYNLFKAANSQGKSSLALPVLGSGGAGASMDQAVEVLAQALTTFHLKDGDRQYLAEILLYTRKDAFGRLCSKLESKLKALPHSHTSNGFVSHPPPRPFAATKPGSGRPSSARGGRNAGSVYFRGGHNSRGNKTGGGKPPPAAAAAATMPAGAGAAAWSTKKLVQNNMDEVSNLSLILSGTTLDRVTKSQSQSQRCQEEDMDTSEEIYPVDSKNDVEEGAGGDHDNEEEKGEEEEEERCAICLDDIQDPKKLHKCGHIFCRDCIDGSFSHHKPVCPTCNTVYGIITGNQPHGTMSVNLSSQSLSGYKNCGMIVIDYEFPSGIQGPEHTNPGQPYHGTARRAFLPDCAEGRKVYRLLRVAFEQRLTFTIGRSVTTGYDNVVTWNDIHHKTRPDGGATGFGYPDPHYLSRVQEELASKGVTEECLRGRTFDL